MAFTCKKQKNSAIQDFIDLLQLRPETLDANTLVQSIRRTSEFHQPLFTLRKIYYPSQGQEVPAYILHPRNLKKNAPGVVVLHTHASNWSVGKSGMVGTLGEKAESFACHLAKRGMIVIAPDMLGFEERIVDSEQDNELNKGGVGFLNAVSWLNIKGDSYLRYAITDIMRAVDVLLTQPEVDVQKIAIVGHSFGGHLASKTAVFDERIKATIAFGSIANVRTKNKLASKLDVTENVYNLLKVGDTENLLSHIAPRKFCISTSANDLYAPHSKEVYNFLKPFWEDSSPRSLQLFDRYKNHHAITKEMTDDAFNWLEQVIHEP